MATDTSPGRTRRRNKVKLYPLIDAGADEAEPHFDLTDEQWKQLAEPFEVEFDPPLKEAVLHAVRTYITWDTVEASSPEASAVLKELRKLAALSKEIEEGLETMTLRLSPSAVRGAGDALGCNATKRHRPSSFDQAVAHAHSLSKLWTAAIDSVERSRGVYDLDCWDKLIFDLTAVFKQHELPTSINNEQATPFNVFFFRLQKLFPEGVRLRVGATRLKLGQRREKPSILATGKLISLSRKFVAKDAEAKAARRRP